ncbi:MAG: hypothetical protein ABTQ29_12380 [Siculibacillus sp.]
MDVTYAYTGLNSSQTRRLVEQRRLMTDLVTQENTGLKSQTYAGVSHRSLTLAFQSKVVEAEAYKSTIATVDPRLSLIGNAIEALSALSNETSGELGQNGFTLTSSGKTPEQTMALNSLEGYVSTLNSEYDGIYVFGGKATDTPPVVDTNTLLEGSGLKAGFKTVAAQRLQADKGSDGLGRLDLTQTGTSVTLAEDGTHPFGFKLSAATSTLANATISGPTGAPPSIGVAFTGVPNADQGIELTLTLPDGSTKAISLKAGATADATKGVFAIGATAADTATNFQTALQTALQTAADTDLTAASAVEAANNFFDTSGGGTPMRVAGPPYDTATALVAGTDADTVIWYRGTNDAGNARADASARVDSDLTIEYGTRANERAFVEQIKQLAVLATLDVSAGGTADTARYQAAVDRTKPILGKTTGSDSLQAVATTIVGAQKASEMASDRLDLANRTYTSAIEANMNADDTELAVMITTLQTQIEASYKATSILYKLSLTDYL